MRSFIQQYMVSAQYFAPRGKERLMFLGEQITHKHLSYTDRLVGIIGDAGAGKSSFIKGMFPGLQLSNDDDIVRPDKIMEVRTSFLDVGDASTFHVDVRFQMAFTQMHEIAEYVHSLLERKRRIVIEHFELLYPILGKNADLMIGIGEEIIVTRPSVFGPSPESIYNIVHESLKYRKMAHSAEDITIQILLEEFGVKDVDYFSSEIRNGFVLKFSQKPEIDLPRLEQLVKEQIHRHLDIAYLDDKHILIGDKPMPCDGPRFHVRNTRDITEFNLHKEMIFDPKSNTYCLIGLVDSHTDDIENRNTHHFLTRDYRT